MTIKEKVLGKESLTVVVQGDSHFWGQGSRGWHEAMPDARCGETRRLPDSVPTCSAMLASCLRDIRGPQKQTQVINSAVGSMPTDKYMQLYFQEWVLDKHPDIVLMMHGINDWIADRKVSRLDFRKNIVSMIQRLFESGAGVILVTQAPVLGNQFSDDNFYQDYIDTVYQIARADARISLADAAALIRAFMSDGDFQQNAQWMYEDCWHCSQMGQFLYLKACTQAMGL